jgi:hypothetical protein
MSINPHELKRFHSIKKENNIRVIRTNSKLQCFEEKHIADNC